jgi:hypothetical protein
LIASSISCISAVDNIVLKYEVRFTKYDLG